MYFHYNKKTGEYLFFAATISDNPDLAHTTEATDFQTNSLGEVVFIPFRVNDCWEMRPRFIITQY